MRVCVSVHGISVGFEPALGTFSHICPGHLLVLIFSSRMLHHRRVSYQAPSFSGATKRINSSSHVTPIDCHGITNTSVMTQHDLVVWVHYRLLERAESSESVLKCFCTRVAQFRRMNDSSVRYVE